MFGLDLKKTAGAIVFTAVVAVAINFIGDNLVHPRKHHAGPMTFAEKAPAAPKEAEKEIPIAVRLATADAADGKRISGKCKSCHDLTDKRKDGIGPALWDIVEADKGANGKFKYSSAMAGKGGKWTYEDLDAFIASPKGFVEGTKMTFPGIKNGKERADLIAYLRSLSNAPKPLPK